MKWNACSSMLLLVAGVFTFGSIVGSAQQTTVAPTGIEKEVRKHLMSLPYYGVFDLLTFKVDNGMVTLGGYVFNDSLKKDAEREAREVKGVTEVQNMIEIAPNLPLDNDIRHGVYHAIYGDAALSRYGTPDSELLSMRPGFRPWDGGFGGLGRGFGGRSLAGPRFGPTLMGAPFYGYDPVGNYAIHILVKNRVVTLAGVVDNDGDKTLVALKARTVANVLQVNNELQVTAKPPTKTTANK